MLLKSSLYSFMFCVCCFASADQSRLESLKPSYKRPLETPFPSSNPYNALKAQLGKMLFFDQRLSRNFNMNCATCHNPSLGWEDGVSGAFGGHGKTIERHSPTIINMAWSTQFFWDGRASSLEEQARGPIEAPVEMNMPLAEVVNRLQKVEGYRTQFSNVFDDGLTEDNILKAIATFERTLVSSAAPFDNWVEGDESAISDSAKQGFLLFNGKAQCSQCHMGWNFTDNKLHDIGLATDDTGREKITGLANHKFHFKTPGLRNITSRAPYMHDGSFPSLQSVLAHYASGGIPRTTRSPLIKPLPLSSRETQQLIDFLKTLTSQDKPMSLPILPV